MQEQREKLVQSLGQEDPLGETMATHSSVLAWEIPWTGEPGGLQSTGSQSAGHDLLSTHACQHKLILTFSLRVISSPSLLEHLYRFSSHCSQYRVPAYLRLLL